MNTRNNLHYCIYENDDVYELCKEERDGSLVLVGANSEVISFPSVCPHCGYDPSRWRKNDSGKVVT